MATDELQPRTGFASRAAAQEENRSISWLYVFSFALLGVYANLTAYGFQYPEGADYNFFLPIANWLRDSSLYPNDPIRDAYPHVQTFFWPIVVLLSRHFATERILFSLFFLTKFIFFAAVSLLILGRVRSRVLCGCIIVALALSSLLNGQTPIGGTIILDQLSEHSALALAIVLLAGVFLVKGTWRTAAVIAALSVYVDALQFLHMLPAFALLAAFDWRAQKRAVVESALLGAAVSLPWYLHFHRSFLTNYPSNYVSALLIQYPLHITLRWTPVSQIIEAAAILVGTVCMGFVARRAGLKAERRLELLAVSYFSVMLAGVLAGWFWLPPNVARFMLQRADSLLIPYAFLLIQIYGANLLGSRAEARPLASGAVSVLAILSPLYDWLRLLLLAATVAYAIFVRRQPKPSPEAGVEPVSPRPRKAWLSVTTSALAACVCVVAIVTSFVLLIASGDVSQLWNFHIQPDPDDVACYDAQLWARDHTPRQAVFMVPPEGCGFRVFSERSSWGEWSDGGAMYFNPSFATTFLSRVAVLDPSPLPGGVGLPDFLTEKYKAQSWDRIRALAAANHLDYILQLTSTRYDATPAYANSIFSIYPAK